MVTMKCLDGIVGGFNTDCDCATANCTPEQIAELQQSASGLYVDEVEGGITLKSVKGADACKDLCQTFIDAINEAEQRTANDVSVALGSLYKQNKQKYIGVIGEKKSTGFATVNSLFAGLKLFPNSTDGVVKVTAVSLLIGQTAQVDINIGYANPHNREAGITLLKTITIDAAANLVSTYKFTEPLLLPLTVNYDPAEYYFYYSTQTPAVTPRNNKLSCNCGNVLYLQRQFVQSYGVELSYPDDVSSAITNGTYANGISLDVEMICDTGLFMCREFDAQDAISLTLAYAVQYKAAEIVIEKVLRSPEINRYTMMNREYLWGKRNHFRKEYQDRIAYIGQNTDITNTDCFICKVTSNDLMVMGILS